MEQSTANIKKRILQILPFVFWFAYAVTVLLDIDLAYNILSPLTALTCVLLIAVSLPTLGRYKSIAIFFMIGIGVWFIADVILFTCTYSFPDNDFLWGVQDNLYLVPDYLFAMGLVAYVLNEFSKNHSQRLLVSTFMLSAIGYMIGMKFIETNRGNGFDPETLSTMLYFFVVLFTLIIMILIFISSSFKSHTRAAYLSAAALSVYNIFEIRYTYMMSVDKDPESVYIDIIYLLSLVIYAISYSDPAIVKRQEHVHKANFVFTSKPHVVWANASLIIIGSIILYFVRFFDMNDIYMLTVSTLGYIIMCKNIQTGELTEKLLEHEKNENARLEKLVNEKTAELQQINDHLQKISNTDALTGLNNRRYGFDYLNTIVDNKEAHPFAIFSLDLNRFKPINDNYGHDAGDKVLKEVGKRLSSIPHNHCIAFRVGGDEFMVVLEKIKDLDSIEGVAKLICRIMDKPIECDENSFDISTSIGIAVFPNDADDIIHLIKYADEAMYAVKHTSEKSVYKLHNSEA
ncbi:MAG: GGDEF domain-containing protein [Lachnospiraceae bacterium]|nr:GGDEF domain-containing protein [Lachnospiraceae bacterium]